MRNVRFIILSALVSLACISVQAQDLKSARDKATGKYGYTGKKGKDWVLEPLYDRAGKFSKEGFAVVTVSEKQGIINTAGEWVIKPEYDDVSAFNKQGFSVLTVKEAKRNRLRGAANTSGEIVMPVQYTDIDFDGERLLILAQLPAIAEDGREIGNIWGIYDFTGAEITAPQFESAPSFDGPMAIVSSGFTGLKGLVGTDGKIAVPLDNIEIVRRSSDYYALGSDYVLKTFDKTGAVTSSERVPGSVYPYDTKDDDMRAITWHKMCVGERLHRNNVKLAVRKGNTRNFECSELPVEWGADNSRFVRLELEKEHEPNAPAAPDLLTGTRYTMAAYLYESDGTLVQCISPSGWLEGYGNEGVVYKTGTGEEWLVFKDVNAMYSRTQGVSLSGYKNADLSSIQASFNLGNAEKNMLNSFARCRDLRYDVLMKENAGMSSYRPRPVPDGAAADAIRSAAVWPIFRAAYAMGDVFPVKMGRDNTAKIQEGAPSIHFSDSIEGFAYKQEHDGPIFWGPTNNWAVRLELETAPASSKDKPIADDVFGSKKDYVIAVNLYDERGAFIRNLGTSTKPRFTEDGSVILEDLGLVFISARSRVNAGDSVPVLPMASPVKFSDIRESGIESGADIVEK